MQIDESDAHDENANFSIRKSLEIDSNVRLESPLQKPKQHSQSCSTDDGIQIDESDEHDENA
jgi:hypothetical protein